MSLRLTKVGYQKCLYEVPGDGWSHSPAAHAKDVHVIVLDALPGREMIMDQGRTNSMDLVSAD